VLVDAAGDVVAAGFLDNRDNYRDFVTMKLEGTTGIVGPARGTRIRVTDYDGKPERRTFQADVFDPLIWTPAGGTLDDPTIAGVEIRIVNPLTLEEASFVLPPGPSWNASGNPPGSYGYTYSDHGTNGPCRYFEARPHNRLKIACSAKSGPIPFTLDEAAQGSLAVTVRFGGSPVQCGVFGGKVRRDTSTSGPGPKGVFQSVQAPPALGTACP
jgi:hypothetical protein